MIDSTEDWARLMQDFPPLPEHQVLLANWREPGIARWSFNHLRQLLPTAPIAAAAISRPLLEARVALDDLVFIGQDGAAHTLAGFLRASQTDCFAVMKDGALAYNWFGGFGALLIASISYFP